MVDMASDQWYAWTVNKHEEIFGSKRVPKLTGLLSVDLLEQKKKKVLFGLALFLGFRKLEFPFFWPLLSGHTFRLRYPPYFLYS